MQKILVVDDDAHIRDVVCFALRRAGYQPLTAGNGRTALEVAAREMPALVVLDILMPELDGTAVCARLRAKSDMPVIFLTSKDEEMDRVLGLELGADDYVVKPFSPRELVAQVKAVLRRKGSAVEAEQTDARPALDRCRGTCRLVGRQRPGADRYRVRDPEGDRRPATPRLHAREPVTAAYRCTVRRRPYDRQPYPASAPSSRRWAAIDRDRSRRRLQAGGTLTWCCAACQASARCCWRLIWRCCSCGRRHRHPAAL